MSGFLHPSADGLVSNRFHDRLNLELRALSSHAVRSAPRLSLVEAKADITVEVLEWEAARLRLEAWSGLVTRALEPNVFLEPAFALPLMQHSAQAYRPVVMLAHAPASDGRDRQLIGLMALNRPDKSFGLLARSWDSNLIALGVPLIDKTRGAEAMEAMLGWLAREQKHTGSLMLSSLSANGPVASLMNSLARTEGLETRSFNAHSRALLLSARQGEPDVCSREGRRHSKELRRQRRRLADMGEITWTSASAPDDVRPAFEKFLALEASGWKGKRGTALLMSPALAAFSRTMTRDMARLGKCRIDALELNHEPIAMGVVLSSGKSSALWKIAYDERLAQYSPGVQFTHEFSSRQSQDQTILYTDSCAQPDHPMINRIWSGRLEIADMMICVSQGRRSEFRRAGQREAMRQRGYFLAKRAYHAATGFGPPRAPPAAR